MEKIGSYIHYGFANYIKYGIGTRERPEQGDFSPQKAFNLQRKIIKENALNMIGSMNKIKIKEEIETKLNFFKYKNGTLLNLGWSDKEIEDLEQRVHEIIAKKLDIEVNSIDWNTLSFKGEDVKNILGKRLSELGTKSEWNDRSAIRNRLKLLVDLRNRIQKGLTEVKNPQNLINQINELLKNYLSIVNSLSYDQKTIKRGTFVKDKVQNVRMGKFGNDFINQLNNIWTQCKGDISSYIKGEVNEMYAGIVSELIKRRSAQEANDFLKEIEKDFKNNVKGLVGSKSGAAVMLTSNFAITGKLSEDANQGHFINNGEAFTNFNGGKAKLHYTKDKVDLEMELQEPIDGGVANLSLKNYNTITGSHIGVHSGRNILSLVQDYSYFINNYLNITAIPKDQGRGSSAALITTANIILKQTMALKGLSGGIWKHYAQSNEIKRNTQAPIFVINDSSGYYKVYFIDDIINLILSNGNLVNISGINDNTTWKTKWVGSRVYTDPNYNDAFGRINNLLAELRAQEIKISINKAAFV